MMVEYRIAVAKPFADPRDGGYNMYVVYMDCEGRARPAGSVISSRAMFACAWT